MYTKKSKIINTLYKVTTSILMLGFLVCIGYISDEKIHNTIPHNESTESTNEHANFLSSLDDESFLINKNLLGSKLVFTLPTIPHFELSSRLVTSIDNLLYYESPPTEKVSIFLLNESFLI